LKTNRIRTYFNSAAISAPSAHADSTIKQFNDSTILPGRSTALRAAVDGQICNFHSWLSPSVG
jgi:hypothetical protein